MPFAAQRLGERGCVDRFVEVDRRGHVAALVRLLDERRRERAGLGPAVEALRAAVAPRRGPVQPTVLQHPLDLVDQQVDGRECGGVVGLIEAGLLQRDAEIQARRHPAVARRDPLDAAKSQPGSRLRARARRRCRSTSVARSSRRPSPPRRSGAHPHPTWRRRARAGRWWSRPAVGRRASRRWRFRCAGSSTRRLPRSRGGADGCRAGSRSPPGRRGAARSGSPRRTSRRIRRRRRAGCAVRRGRTQPSPRRPWSPRCSGAPRSRRAARTARRGPRGPGARPTGHLRGGARSRGSRELHPRARRPPRCGPWTDLSRSARRRGSGRGGARGRPVSSSPDEPIRWGCPDPWSFPRTRGLAWSGPSVR